MDRFQARIVMHGLHLALFLGLTLVLGASQSRGDIVITNMNESPTNGQALSTTGSNSNQITFTPGQQGLYHLILNLKLWNNENANGNGNNKDITSATLNFSSVGTQGSSTALGSVTSNTVNILRQSYGIVSFDLGDINLGSGRAEIVFSLTGVTGGSTRNNVFWAAGGSTYTDSSSTHPGWATIQPTAAIGGASSEFQWSLETTSAPEPGTLLLGLIASSVGGGTVWWKRRKRIASNAAVPSDCTA